MIKIGLTGGIGSGKSVVASLLKVAGIPVYIADEESKRLTNISPIIKEQLISLFGKELYTREGLNKKLLASYIFTNTDYLKQVNAIIHPVVDRDFREWLTRQTTDIVVIETAILFESGFHQLVDKSLMVYAPLEIRIKRTMERDRISKEEVLHRINNQLSDEIKKERADYVIYNDNKHALIPQLQKIIVLNQL